MTYDEKLRLFFKSKGLTQKKVSEELNIAPAMISRYINGVSVFPADFLTALVKHYPDIDLQYIFSDDEIVEKDSMDKNKVVTNLSESDLVKELQLIEDKIARVRNVLAQNRHEK